MKHLRPIIALLSLSALTGGAVQAKTVDTEALRVDYQAVEQYSSSTDYAVTEHVLGPDGSSITGNWPACRFCLPPLAKAVLNIPLLDGSDALPLYLLYGALLFYDPFTGFA
ncbi:MAG: hypothetical protein GVY26_22475 [Bacteroidetes bacterium]|nr:hypothetical protein [Bacteroidota bacterium]